MTEGACDARMRLAHPDLVAARMLATMPHDVAPRVAQCSVRTAEKALKAALAARGVR